MQLTGKNILITGGSAGLGAECAKKFAAEGCNIAINYANFADRAEKFVKELKSTFPNLKFSVIQADVGIKSSCEKLIEETISQLGGLDVIISNAGSVKLLSMLTAGWTQFCPFEDLDFPEEAWDKCFAVNIKAHVWLLRAALPTFNKNANGGHLLITGSIAAHIVGGSSMAYAVTKAGQVHLIRCLAKSQGPKSQRYTTGTASVGMSALVWALANFEGGLKYGNEMIEAHKQLAPLKAATDMGDCADAFVMLAKNESITGSALTIDAGLSLMSRNR